MKIKISEPQLIKPIGKIKVSKEYHFLSHRDGGCELEQQYLQRTNGFLHGSPWFSNNNTYDAKDFYLCSPNGVFALTFHTFSMGYCVSHYYKAKSIDGLIIELEFIGQNGRCDFDSTIKCLYKIGDNPNKPFIFKPIKWWNFLFKF